MKTCKTCGEQKSLSEYYKHSGMKDGFLNNCKSCVRTRIKLKNRENAGNKEKREKERLRGIDKYNRLYKNKKAKSHRSSFLRNLSRKVKNSGINTSDIKLHHEDINVENVVMIVDKRVHKLIHSYSNNDDFVVGKLFSLTLGVNTPVRITVPF